MEHNPLENKRNIDPVGDALFEKYKKLQEEQMQSIIPSSKDADNKTENINPENKEENN